jgi:ABC-type branched-subunit amino acid transport system substrate-binding protein
MWQRAGQALVGVPFPVNFSSELSTTPAAKAFIEGYHAKFGTDPDVYSACGYSAAYFFAQGLAAVSGLPSREALAASLSQIRHLDHNVYGGVTLAEGQAQTDVTMFAAWTPQGTITPWQAP